MAEIRFADVSKFQGNINWAEYCAARDAVIIRAHSGYGVDPYFAANRSGAQTNGIKLLGLYQYVAPDVSVSKQAQELLDTVGTLRANEFLVADIEDSQITNWSGTLTSWCSVIEEATNRPATIYTGDEHVPTMATAMGSRPRWVARYRSAPPDNHYDIWQHTDSAVSPGIGSPCDESVYEGTLAQLSALVLGSAAGATDSLLQWAADHPTEFKAAFAAGLGVSA